MSEEKIAQNVTSDRNIFTATGDVHIYKSSLPLPPVEAEERRDLRILLKRVKTFWIEGVLEKSVHNMALIDLGKETQAEAVAHAWEQILELPNQSRQTLPPDKKISQIFDELDRSLLILGAPGSGKTITLLQLAHDLLNQAVSDETYSQAIPVIFNLSTWNKDVTLFDWLGVELVSKYQIPKRIGRQWLEHHRILPLLDGLDEVRSEHRNSCVEAINQFREEFGLAGLVVCSRTEEYISLSKRLTLNGAVRLQPLTLDQVYDYLDMAGSKLEALQKALQIDESLKTLATSPLMLGIMSLAYQDIPAKTLVNPSLSAETRRKHLFDTYVERMFKRKGHSDKPYSDAETKNQLSWLGQQMNRHNQAVFLIEQFQPDWLSSPLWRRSYIFISRLLIGLIIGLIVGVSFLVSFGLGISLGLESNYVPQFIRVARYPVGQIDFSDRWIVGLVFGLLGGLVLGLFDTWRLETRKDTTEQDKRVLLPLLLQTLIIVLVIAVSFAFTFGLKLWTVDVLIVLLSYSLCIGAIVILRGRTQSLSNDIQTVETLNWSWRRAIKFGGLIGVPLAVLFWALTNWVGFAEPSAIGLVFVLAGAIFGGLKTGIVEAKTTPNQGIRLSVRNSLFTGGIFGVVVSTVTILTMTLQGYEFSLEPLLWNSTVGVILGLVLGALAALWYGGLDVIQHYILYIILYFQGKIPFNYVKFLDYAADRIFLQKVGGGYIFIHRLLLDYFVALEPKTFQAIRKRTTMAWVTVGLFLVMICVIVIVFTTITLPQSRYAVHSFFIFEEVLELAEQGKIDEALRKITSVQESNNSFLMIRGS